MYLSSSLDFTYDFLPQAVSGRPPPAASMAVGQFFSPKDGQRGLSPGFLLLSGYSPKVESYLTGLLSGIQVF